MNCWIILLMLCQMNGRGCQNGCSNCQRPWGTLGDRDADRGYDRPGKGFRGQSVMGACQEGCDGDGDCGMNAMPGSSCNANSMPVNPADGCGCSENQGPSRNFPTF